MPCEKLLDFLKENRISFQLIVHPQAYTAQEIADRAHISGKQFAKTVMVAVDGKMAMAVLPAAKRLNLTLLKRVADADDVVLAAEKDFKDMFPDCDLGAMPPFGNLYGLDVYVAGSLGEAKEIAFNAGTHTELIKMSYQDFEHIVQPKIARFSYHEPREQPDDR